MEMTVEKIVHGGLGLCRIRGGVVLVPYAVPGDVVEVSFNEGGGGVSFGWIREVRNPSPSRRQSDCPVFGICGGCDFDNMSYECEIKVKEEVLEEDLGRIAGIRNPVIDRTIVSQNEYGYRNHAQFKVKGAAGFFMKQSHEVVPLPVQGCLLLDPVINAYFNSRVRSKILHPGGFRIRSNNRGEVFQKGIPGIVPDGFATYYPKDLRLRVGIDDFFQVNRFTIDGWLDQITRYLEPERSDKVFDLYCGSGLISLYIARFVRSVSGIELNRRAVQNAFYNARANGIENVAFYRADAGGDSVFKMPADKVVVDPPRTGLTSRLVSGITSMRPSVVVYASCDTATFARDIRLFTEEGYVLDRVTPVDMFPRTRHSEVVARIVEDGKNS